MEVGRSMSGSNRPRAWLPFRSSICRNRRAIWRARNPRGVDRCAGIWGTKAVVQRCRLLIETHRMVATAFVAAALIVAHAEQARAQSAAEFCLTANQSLSLGTAVPRTSTRLKAGALRIVAVGSSSTAGLWVLGSDGTYPEVMRRELAALRPTAQVEVINSGRIGDTVWGSMARFRNDVLAYAPDLIVWQLGTNDVAWGGRAEGLKDQIVVGVRTLKADGADVILMDLQYA